MALGRGSSSKAESAGRRLVRPQVVGQLGKDGSTVGQVAEMVLEGRKARDRLAPYLERGDSVRNALFGLGQGRKDRQPQKRQGCALRFVQGVEVLVDLVSGHLRILAMTAADRKVLDPEGTACCVTSDHWPSGPARRTVACGPSSRTKRDGLAPARRGPVNAVRGKQPSSPCSPGGRFIWARPCGRRTAWRGVDDRRAPPSTPPAVARDAVTGVYDLRCSSRTSAKPTGYTVSSVARSSSADHHWWPTTASRSRSLQPMVEGSKCGILTRK
jgi:hypothetical protein